MARQIGRLASLALLLFVGPAARAQEGDRTVVVGPGSTATGDVARGMGLYYDGAGQLYRGAGQYELQSAMGRSIDTDTAMKWNDHVYNARKSYNRDRLEKIAKERQWNKLQYEAIRQRVRDKPNETDLMTGDALNVVLEELSDPKLDPKLLREVALPLDGGTLQTLPFSYGELAGIISMRQLSIRDGWPLPMRGPEFAAERRAYMEAVDAVLDREPSRPLTPEAVKRVRRAVEGLEAKLNKAISPNDRAYYQARDFLKGLNNAARMLEVPLAEAVLARMDRYPGTDLADLLEFMQNYNLRFGPATVPAERELYRSLYPLLLQQREQLTARLKASPGRGGVAPPPEHPALAGGTNPPEASPR